MGMMRRPGQESAESASGWQSSGCPLEGGGQIREDVSDCSGAWMRADKQAGSGELGAGGMSEIESAVAIVTFREAG
jgi:hypothetical protein